MMQADSEVLAKVLSTEAEKAQKLSIIFGPWWRHYAVPYEFVATLYCERDFCLYCGGQLGSISLLGAGVDISHLAHLDHMDPLFRGGEESIRNAVYCCEKCNISKGRRLFTEWMSSLEEPHRSLAANIYEAKHGHPARDFAVGTRQIRLTRPRYELGLDIRVIQKLFPKPIVSGPPHRSLSR